MVLSVQNFLSDHATLLQALAAVVAILLFIWGILRGVWRRSQPTAPLKVEATLTQPPGDARLTTAQFIAIRRQLREELVNELSTAHGEERAQLQARIDDLTAQLADPEGAFEKERQRLADLENRLLREGKEIGAEKLNAALETLREGRDDDAKALFEEIAARDALAVERVARAEFALGEIAEGRVDWRAAAAHYETAARLNPTYDTLIKAGEFLRRAGLHKQALAAEEELLRLSRAEFGPCNPKTATAMNNLAATCSALGDYKQAEPLYREALEIDRQALGERHPDYAIDLNNLASLLRVTGRVAEAEPLYREALEISREALGDRHPYYAIDLNNLASLLQATGRVAEAEPLFREALEIGRETLGDRHPDVATRLNNLALLLRATGRYAEAEPLFREALEIGRATLGDRHPDVAKSLNDLAGLLEDTGRVAEAEPLYREALEIRRETWGDRHPDVAQSLNNLAGLLWRTGRAMEAVPFLLEAVDIMIAALPAGHPNTRTVARNTLSALRAHAPDHPRLAEIAALAGE
ncbi:MAG: tetratricopeptide repeat protein [Paracoccaceae bacterium]